MASGNPKNGNLQIQFLLPGVYSGLNPEQADLYLKVIKVLTKEFRDLNGWRDMSNLQKVLEKVIDNI